KELGRLDAEITRIEGQITNLKQQYPVPSDYLNLKWYLDLKQEEEPLIQKGRYLHDVLTNHLLKSLDASSKRLEATSKAQTATTVELEKSERRVGAISAALLL